MYGQRVMFFWTLICFWGNGWFLLPSTLAAPLSERMMEQLRSQSSVEGTFPPFIRLQQALVDYQKILARGGWPHIPAGPKLQKGDQGKRVALLRTRLQITGDLVWTWPEQEEQFDDELEQAVRHFQKRHGLVVDGIVGPKTLAALNISTEERLRQIKRNLGRQQLFVQRKEAHYILVNLPDFSLQVIEQEATILTMRVIIGREFRFTPLLSSTIKYFVLNPYWYVPRSIAIQDIIPKLSTDPTYLLKHRIRVFRREENTIQEISPTAVDWSQVTSQNFIYTFRQDPGPWNALGRIKFIFPNSFNVYLHDTPARELFKKPVRAFSSGCIRVEKPLELAEYLLQGDPLWPRERLLAVLEKGKEQTVWLPEPYPIHLVYWTAWVDNEGILQFREDIYKYDRQLDQAFQKEVSSP